MMPIAKTRKAVRSPGLRHAARAAAFARRLMTRYVRGRASRRVIDLPLVSAPHIIVQNIVRRYLVAASMPSLRTVLAPRPNRTADARMGARRGTASDEARPLEPVPDPGPVSKAHGEHAALLLRIVQRTQRIEIRVTRTPTASSNAADIGGSSRGAAESSLPLILPAPAAVATQVAPASAQQPNERRHSGFEAAIGDRRAAAAPGMPYARAVSDQEIERLAERVIGTIDRRIAARRERLGRP